MVHLSSTTLPDNTEIDMCCRNQHCLGGITIFYLTYTIWDVIGALLIIGGIVRLVAPTWVKKKGIGLAKWLMKLIPKFSDSMIRLIGLVMILVGALLMYFY